MNLNLLITVNMGLNGDLKWAIVSAPLFFVMPICNSLMKCGFDIYAIIFLRVY